MDIKNYWKAVLRQHEQGMRHFFHENAYVNWHNTNEHFTVDEFVKANCEYPGQWNGEIERIVENSELLITVVHVFSHDKKESFHVTSFMKIENEKIVSIDEYWGDDGAAPRWRQEQCIGTPIKQ